MKSIYFLFAAWAILITLSSCKDCYECTYPDGFVDECCEKNGPGSNLFGNDCYFLKDDCRYEGGTLVKTK